MRRALAIGVLASAVLLGAGAGGAYLWLQRWLDRPGPLRADVVVDLPAGASLREIAGRIADSRVVTSGLAFEAVARLEGQGARLRAGEYQFGARVTPREALELLATGRVLHHPIVVPEGLTVSEVFDLLAASGVLAGDLPEPPPPEGSLLPETWFVPRGEPRARLVARMRRGMDEAVATAWAARAPDLPLAGPREALALASLVERETAISAERPIVAGVFVNRLRQGMRLQSDPTVAYALAPGRGSIGRDLTRDDLRLEHPYNTYAVDGLPPGPIANPGRAALEATVRPAAVDYLYFVADGEGGHAFATTLPEHNRNVARWRRSRAGAGPPQPEPSSTETPTAR